MRKNNKFLLVGLSFTLLIFSLFFISCKSKSSASVRKSINTISATDSGTLITTTKANYNIYIENSGSMDGFVTTGSDFKNAVMGLITDLKSKRITDTISLFYINKDICPQKPKALPEEIKMFIDALNPSEFKKSNCGRNTSYIPSIIKKVIAHTENDINILVSDFIFSDSAGTSLQYLESAQNSVELFFSDELNNHDFSTIILKFNSQFEGNYYIESQRPKSVDLRGRNIRRPYYMMIFGNQEKLNQLLSHTSFSEYSGFENSYYLLTPSSSKPYAKIIRDNKKGYFDIENPATSLRIKNAKSKVSESGENEFQFSIATDLNFLKVDETYLSDPGNYDISENYRIVAVEKNQDETNLSLKGFSHVFIVKTLDLKLNQNVSIKLKSKIPLWVSKSSTNNDSNPFDSAQQTQTFGFKYLVKGISEGYDNKYENKEQFAINIFISKGNGSSNDRRSKLPVWPFVLMAFFIGLIIWLKNKK